MQVLRALSHRPFAWLCTGQTISRLGDSLYRIALAWWVLEKTGSAVAMGTVMVFTQVPLLIFLLIGGIVVDRVPRLRIMFVADVLCGLVVSFIAVFTWLDLLQIWHIYLASLIFGFVEAFFFPAYQAVIPHIVPHLRSSVAKSLLFLGDAGAWQVTMEFMLRSTFMLGCVLSGLARRRHLSMFTP